MSQVKSKICIVVALVALFVLTLATPVLSAPTQDDVFRSLSRNMEAQPDYGRLLPWLCAAAGLVAVIIYLSQRQKRQAVPKTLNHPGKLLREVIRVAELDPDEMKQLKALAQEQNCQSPLTLLLCPSLRGGEENKSEEPESSAPAQ
jgi:hypothetical protein